MSSAARAAAGSWLKGAIMCTACGCTFVARDQAQFLGCLCRLPAGLMYEWLHYIVHTRWVPPPGWRGKWLREVRRHHMLHHMRNENFWLSFSAPQGQFWGIFHQGLPAGSNCDHAAWCVAVAINKAPNDEVVYQPHARLWFYDNASDHAYSQALGWYPSTVWRHQLPCCAALQLMRCLAPCPRPATVSHSLIWPGLLMALQLRQRPSIRAAARCQRLHRCRQLAVVLLQCSQQEQLAVLLPFGVEFWVDQQTRQSSQKSPLSCGWCVELVLLQCRGQWPLPISDRLLERKRTASVPSCFRACLCLWCCSCCTLDCLVPCWEQGKC